MSLAKSLIVTLIGFLFVTAGASTALADDHEGEKEYIKFQIDHSDSAKGLVNGSFGKFELTEAKVDLDNLGESYAEYAVDLSTIDTGNSKRDAHLKSADFFNVEKFGKATLRIDNIKKGDGESHTADATVSLHGVEKTMPVTFKVVEKKKDGSIVVEGKTDMKRSQFEVGGAPEKSGAADPLTVMVKLHVKTTG